MWTQYRSCCDYFVSNIIFTPIVRISLKTYTAEKLTVLKQREVEHKSLVVDGRPSLLGRNWLEHTARLAQNFQCGLYWSTRRIGIQGGIQWWAGSTTQLQCHSLSQGGSQKHSPGNSQSCVRRIGSSWRCRNLGEGITFNFLLLYRAAPHTTTTGVSPVPVLFPL